MSKTVQNINVYTHQHFTENTDTHMKKNIGHGAKSGIAVVLRRVQGTADNPNSIKPQAESKTGCKLMIPSNNNRQVME